MTSFFGSLFGKKKQSSGPMRDVSVLAEGSSTPAVQVVTQAGASRSHFGGSPRLPGDCAWPTRAGKKLAFLARISLTEVHAAHPVDWLPSTGALLFFYDMDKQPWGFDPKDRGGWSVLLVPDLADACVLSVGQSADASSLTQSHIGFRRIESFPSFERDVIQKLDLSDEEFEKYEEVTDHSYGGKPKHQISGFPAPVQGDGMELECQLASNGLYCGDSTGYNDVRATSLAPGARDWKLLFQLDSDEELDVMWGDCGTIYFWVEESSARSGDFSNAWLILQCC